MTLQYSYSVLLADPAFPIGTSPEEKVLSSKTFQLKQTEPGALDTFEFNPAYGLFKAGSVPVDKPARYLFFKRGSTNTPYSIFTELFPNLKQYPLIYYQEYHLSFDDASPFKMTFEILPGLSRYIRSCGRRVIFEATTLGNIYYWLEEYDQNQPDSTRQVTEPRYLDLSWLSAPYFFVLRIYQTVAGIFIEVRDEYNYYSTNPTITDFFDSRLETVYLNNAYVAVSFDLITAGKHPAIVSVGHGVDDLSAVTIRDMGAIEKRLGSNGVYFSTIGETQSDALGAATFGLTKYIYSESFGSNNELLIPDYMIIVSEKLSPPAWISFEDDTTPASCILLDGGKIKVDIKQNFNIFQPPGNSLRIKIFFKSKK